MSEANKRQVGGQHYAGAVQHWDLVVLFAWDYFQAQVTKYLMRWRQKNGVQDLEKAAHFLQRYIEAVKAGQFSSPVPAALPRGAWLQLLGAAKEPQGASADLTARFVVPDNMILMPRGKLNPTGYIGYTYEGSKGGPGADGKVYERDMFRCLRCRRHFTVPLGDPPFSHESECPGIPESEHVDLDFPVCWQYRQEAVSMGNSVGTRAVVGEPPYVVRDGAVRSAHGWTKSGEINLTCPCGAGYSRRAGEDILGARQWVEAHRLHLSVAEDSDKHARQQAEVHPSHVPSTSSAVERGVVRCRQCGREGVENLGEPCPGGPGASVSS